MATMTSAVERELELMGGRITFQRSGWLKTETGTRVAVEQFEITQSFESEMRRGDVFVAGAENWIVQKVQDTQLYAKRVVMCGSMVSLERARAQSRGQEDPQRQ